MRATEGSGTERILVLAPLDLRLQLNNDSVIIRCHGSTSGQKATPIPLV